MNKVNVTLSLNEDIYREFKKWCIDRKVKVSDMVTDYMRKRMKKKVLKHCRGVHSYKKG